MIISLKKILDVAKKNRFAVASPNVYSMETVECAYQAARELNAPVILMVWDGGPEWVEKVGNICKFFEKKYPDVVCSLILDHGGSYESEMTALRSGFSGIMSDRSKLPFEENVREVRKTVEPAHAVNVAVEAELGHVGEGLEYEETRDSGLTNPDEALEFIRRTEVDCLAVAVGTSHGVYKGTPHIDFDLLDKLDKLVDIPLVLHGGSGTGDDNLAKAVEHGINKVNLCSDLMLAMEKAVRQDALEKDQAGYRNTNAYDLYFMGILDAGHKGWTDCLKHYMKLFKSEGKAELYREYKAVPEANYYGEYDASKMNIM